MSTVDELLQANAAYARDFDQGGLPMPPSRKVAVVACMDARLDVYRLLGLSLGQAHVIRNAGGVVSDDVIRSLVISQQLLGTREVMLVHHTDCGMLTFRDDELKDRLEQRTGVRPAFAMEAFRDPAADVAQSLRRLRASPLIPADVPVRGFVYQVETGRLEEVGAS